MGELRETFILTSPDNAYTLANELKTDYNLHRVSTTYHKATDTTNSITSTDATTLATLYTLINEIKLDFNAHEASTTYHRAGSANQITSPDATSAVTAYELLTEIKEKYNKHIRSETYHMVADTSNPITTLASKLAAVNKDFNADGGSVLVELTGAGSWDGTVDFKTTPDGATFYNIPYISRSTITPTPTVAQISSPSTAAIYLLLGPLSQVRIACATGTQGTLTVVFRTISKADLVVAYLAAGTNEIGKLAAGSAAIGKLAANDGVDIGDVDVKSTTITKTVETELNAIAAVAANAQDKSSTLALTNMKKVAIFIDHGRDATGAFVGAGTEYRVEVSEKATGNDTWRTIATATAVITAALGHVMDAEEAAGQTVIEIGATTPLEGDIQFFKNATIANSEWGKVVALSDGVSLTLQDGLTNTQAAITTYSQGEHFVLLLDVAAYTRLRVICNNNNGTTNQAIVWRCAAIDQT